MGKGRSPSVTKVCEHCARAYHPWRPKGVSRFCSWECARASGSTGARRTVEDKECEACGVLFRPLSQGRHQKFCSRECYRRGRGPVINSQGYVLLYQPEHPNAFPSGQVLEHRVVMEGVLGRLLIRTESVHHINGVKDDNRPENLELWVGVGKQPSGVRAKDVTHCPTCTCNH